MDSSFILFTLLQTETEPATETCVFNKDKVIIYVKQVFHLINKPQSKLRHIYIYISFIYLHYKP